jgi:hypothetical protein
VRKEADLMARARRSPIRIDARRAQRQRNRSAALALLLVLALVGVSCSLIPAASQRESERPSSASGSTSSIPDTLLLMQAVSSRVGPGAPVFAYLPASNTLVPLPAAFDQPLISPDGEQLIFSQVSRQAQDLNATLVSVDSHTLASRWTRSVASFTASSEQSDYATVEVSPAVIGDRVYVATNAFGSAG